MPSKAAFKKVMVATVAAVALAGTMLATAEPAQAFRGGFGGFRGGFYRPFGGGFGRFGYGGFRGGFGRFGYGGFGYRRFGYGYGFRRFGYGFYPGLALGVGYGLGAGYGYGYPYGGYGYGAPYGDGEYGGYPGYQQTGYRYRSGLYNCGPYERHTRLEHRACHN